MRIQYSIEEVCSKCPITKSSSLPLEKRYVAPINLSKAKYIFIFDWLYKDEIEVLRALEQEPRFNLVYSYLLQIKNIPKSQIGLIYLISCKQSKHYKFELKEETLEKRISFCKWHLFNKLFDLAQENTILLCFGKYVCKAILNLSEPKNHIFKYKSLVLEKNKQKKKFLAIPLVDPRKTLIIREYADYLRKGLETILKIENELQVQEEEIPKILLNTKEDIVKFLQDMLKQNFEYMVLDIETGSTNFTDVLLGISLYFPHLNKAYYLSIRNLSELELTEIKELFDNLVKNKKIIGHNLPFDFTFLFRDKFITHYNFEVIDTKVLAHFVYNKSITEKLGLKELCKILFRVQDWDEPLKKFKSFKDIPENILYEYACYDTIYTYKLYKHLKNEFIKMYEGGAKCL